MQGGSGGCLSRRHQKVLWELAGQEAGGWVESGKAASGRWTLKNVWVLSMPR